MKSFLIIATIFVALALANVSARSLEDRIECFRLDEEAQPRIYETQIKALIEKLKEQLKQGIPEQNIPAMDPFVMNNMNIAFEEETVRFNATATGEVVGLTNLDVTKLTVSIAGFRVTYGFNFPAISVKVKYSVDGEIVQFIPFYGSGDIDATIYNLSLVGTGKIGSKGTGDEQVIFLENFEAKLAIGAFDFKATGLLNDEGISALLSKMLAESVPGFLDQFSEQISAELKTQVHALAEKALEGKTMKDILDMILGKNERYIHCGDYD